MNRTNNITDGPDVTAAAALRRTPESLKPRILRQSHATESPPGDGGLRAWYGSCTAGFDSSWQRSARPLNQYWRALRVTGTDVPENVLFRTLSNCHFTTTQTLCWRSRGNHA
jgi:hypothetical protein